jgi:hypothetical protein
MSVSEHVTVPATKPEPRPAAPPPARPSAWRYAGTALHILQVRLRFLLILAAAFLVVGKWQELRSVWDRLTRKPNPAAEAVSPDTEYWCPMCPGVLSDWPGKCPVCNMALVRRQRGEAVPLPDGVLARMQLSPYRLQLAGVQTSPVEYRPLALEVALGGLVESDDARLRGALTVDLSRVFVRAEVFEKDIPLLSEGQAVEVTSDAFPGRAPFAGKVRLLGPQAGADPRTLYVRLDIDNPRQELRPGMFVMARSKVPVAQRDWFVARLAEDWRDRVAADLLAHSLFAPAGPGPGAGVEPLLGAAWRQAMLRKGLVPAVPESAVVDTGMKKVVYVESGPGMFDGVEVVVGPRCGDYYPVLRGVEAGQRVATAGAFLLDAETRLNPGVAAGYFGAARGAAGSPPAGAAAAPQAANQLSAEDQALAVRQKVCPVTGEPLDSMGVPVRVVVNGRTVFVCCKACEPELRKNFSKYLSKLPGK